MQYVVWRGKKEDYDLFSDEDGETASTPTLSYEQYLKLEEFLKKKDNPTLLPIQIAYYTGLRIGEVCGFVYLASNSKIVFVMFLAVDKSLRSKGYGSCILQQVKNKYPNKKIIISIEPCDENASDIELRKRRKLFYMRNGYKETGYMMKLNGVTQEIIITNGEFVKKQFRSSFALYSNGTMWPQIWDRKGMHIID